jgi:hypothetical protein
MLYIMMVKIKEAIRRRAVAGHGGRRFEPGDWGAIEITDGWVTPSPWSGAM